MDHLKSYESVFTTCLKLLLTFLLILIALTNKIINTVSRALVTINIEKTEIIT